MEAKNKRASYNFDPVLMKTVWGADVKMLLLHLYQYDYTNRTEIRNHFGIGSDTLGKVVSESCLSSSLTCLRFVFVFAYYINRREKELAVSNYSPAMMRVEKNKMKVTKRLFKDIYAGLADFTLFAASKIDLRFVYKLEKDNFINYAVLKNIYHDIGEDYIKTHKRYHLRFCETTDSAGKEPGGQDEAPPTE